MTQNPHDALLEDLKKRRDEGRSMGGVEGIAKHHASGRLTVRERIERLIDADSFHEIGMLAKPELRREKPIPGDAVVTGYAKLYGRNVGLIGIDSSVVAGTTAPVRMRTASPARSAAPWGAPAAEHPTSRQRLPGAGGSTPAAMA